MDVDSGAKVKCVRVMLPCIQRQVRAVKGKSEQS